MEKFGEAVLSFILISSESKSPEGKAESCNGSLGDMKLSTTAMVTPDH